MKENCEISVTVDDNEIQGKSPEEEVTIIFRKKKSQEKKRGTTNMTGNKFNCFYRVLHEFMGPLILQQKP